jgi:hypothetical protein
MLFLFDNNGIDYWLHNNINDCGNSTVTGNTYQNNELEFEFDANVSVSIPEPHNKNYKQNKNNDNLIHFKQNIVTNYNNLNNKYTLKTDEKSKSKG